MSRFVSFQVKNIMALCIQVEPINFSGMIRFSSRLQANVENHTRKTNPIVDYGPFGCKIDTSKIYTEQEVMYYEGTTQNSKLTFACGSLQKVRGKQAVITE